MLHGCGSALKEAKNLSDAERDLKAEAELAVRTLRLNTLSKLTTSDSVHFDALVKDVFPSVTHVEILNEKLVEAIKISYQHLQLEENPRQVNKN